MNRTSLTDLVLQVQDLYPGLTERRLEQEYLLFQKNCSLGKIQQNFQDQILAGIPLEYINNECSFFNSVLYVDERVLIPRSETELLVELGLKACSNLRKNHLRICEIGVGSGAISLSLLTEIKRPVELVATDISAEALAVAELNLSNHRILFHPESCYELLLGDCFNPVSDKLFDLIISNPPYIKRSQQNTVHAQVKQFEPDVALFLADKDYQLWYRLFFENSLRRLEKAGTLLLEGHEENLTELKSIALEIGFTDVVLLNDFNQQLRYLKATL